MVMTQTEIKPLVSIIIPVYNGADFLKQAINSALAQTYEKTEILVINDGSKDKGKTEEIALSYGSKIRYFKKENGGVSSALNLGLKQMRGEYFSWLSHDDEYEPKKIEKQVALLQKYPGEKLLALCGTKFIDKNGKTLRKNWPMPSQGKYNSAQALNFVITKTLSGISLLIPKQALLESGNFDTSLKFIQDMDIWYKIFLNGYGLLTDNTILAKSRLHQAQQTHLQKQRFSDEIEQISPYICEKLSSKKYYDTLKTYWLYLLKNKQKKSAAIVKEKLKQEKCFDSKTKIKGFFYSCYGKMRPLIRKVYYRFLFDIEIKNKSSKK